MNNIITKELKGQDVVPVLAVPVSTVGRVFWQDMPKFGGPGRKKKACEKRICLNLKADEVIRNI